MREYYPLMSLNGEQGRPNGDEGRPEPPEYKVYRSRPGLLSSLRAPDLTALRERLSGKGGGGPRLPTSKREPTARRPPAE